MRAEMGIPGHDCHVNVSDGYPYYPGHPGYYAQCYDCGWITERTDDPRDAHRAINFHLRAVRGEN